MNTIPPEILLAQATATALTAMVTELMNDPQPATVAGLNKKLRQIAYHILRDRPVAVSLVSASIEPEMLEHCFRFLLAMFLKQLLDTMPQTDDTFDRSFYGPVNN